MTVLTPWHFSYRRLRPEGLVERGDVPTKSLADPTVAGEHHENR